jgi:nucleotide-binding universal stress UspA family protein
MFERIVVPLDGSRLAEGALRHAIAVALACQAELRLVRVVERQEGERHVPDLLAWQLRLAEARSYLEGVQRWLVEKGLQAEVVTMEGSPARRIVDYTHEQEADLVILSSHGRSGLERWNVSGLVQKVIQDVKTSLFLVPAYQEPVWGEEAIGYRRIMVPLDGSKRAEYTLPLAECLASYWDAELLFVHVMVPPRLFQRLPPAAEETATLQWFVERNQEEAAAYFTELQERLPVRVRSQVRLKVSDDVVSTFYKIVHGEEIDLMLFAAHGQTCSQQRRYGSLVTCCLLYGCAPTIVVQDQPMEQIAASSAEEVLRALETEELRLPKGAVSARYS